MRRLAGIVFILGFVAFFFGVVQPVMGEVFGTSDAAEQLQYMQASPEQWQTATLWMGIGGAIVAVGAVLFVLALKQSSPDDSLINMAYAATTLIVIANVVWAYICYYRISSAAEQVAGNQDVNVLVGSAYALSFLIGLVLMGYISMQRYSKWTGIAMIVIEIGMSALSFFAFGSVAPAIHFLPLLIVGIMLIFAGGKQTVQDSINVVPNLQSQ